jgi:hypothetical protein
MKDERTATKDGKAMEAILEVRRSLPLLSFGVDLVVRSRAVIERRKNSLIGF